MAYVTGDMVANDPVFTSADAIVGSLFTATGDPVTFNDYGYHLGLDAPGGNQDAPLVSRLSPQFMSTDGSGPPDVPKIASPVPELECLSCATPLSNTNSENTCVNAKTEQTVKCKTLAWYLFNLYFLLILIFMDNVLSTFFVYEYFPISYILVLLSLLLTNSMLQIQLRHITTPNVVAQLIQTMG